MVEPYLTGAAGGGFGAFVMGLFNKWRAEEKNKDLHKRIDEGAKRTSELELYAARTYATKDDLKAALEPITEALKTINVKLDRLDDKLNTKADK